MCGQCGVEFVAGRRDARWCSNACRVRAWRQRHASAAPVANAAERTGLLERIATLEAALRCAQEGNVCAVEGCQLGERGQVERGRIEEAHRADVAAWGEQEWNHPVARELREQLGTQANELVRLREENALLRRWVSERVGAGHALGAGR